MLANFTQKLAGAFRASLPSGTVFLFVLAGAAAWPVPYLGVVLPSFGLAAVYYWAIYRPDLFRPSAAFFLGLLNDLLHFLPPGLSALLFVGAYQLSFSQRRFFVGQFFSMLWAGFAVIAVLAALLSWIVVSLEEGQALAVTPAALQLLFTLLAFPLPAWILIRLQRAFLTAQG